MADDDFVTRLFRLWDEVPAGNAAVGAFATIYTDPVWINGAETPLADLVTRARVMSSALTERSTEVLSQVRTPDHVAIAFRIRARHAGPLGTPLGDVPATGEIIEVSVIDILALDQGRIRDIRMVADGLAPLSRIGAVSVAS